MGQLEYRGSKGYGAVRIGDHANLNLGEVIVLGTRTYEWDDGGGVGAGNIAVIKGADAAADITALVAAINANKPSPAATAYVDPVDTAVARIETDKQSDLGLLAFTTTMADSDNVIAAVSAKLAGAESSRLQVIDEGEYIVTALDILATNIMIPTSHSTPRKMTFLCYTTNGDLKVITWRGTISNGRIKITTNGATAPIAGDRILWKAYE